MQPFIFEAKNITKYFYEPEKFQVLKNVNLQIQRGEFLSLIGKSGSGKSTLLYVLSTMDTDYNGELFMNGELLTNSGQDRLSTIRNEHIGFVFQFHYLLPEFSCIKNVMLPAMKLKKFSMEEIEQRAYEKLKLLDVHDLAKKSASKISGGQQQRVAIARALINEPTIIMGDEPTGNLDSKNTEAVLEIFKEITKKYNQTIITVTHDNDFARKTDRIIELCDGEIIN